MSVITVVIPPPIICIQTEQEFSGTSLPQLPAIIWNDCIHENNPFPHWFTLRLSLSHFLSGTHAYTFCFGISRSFLQIKSKLLPYFTTTSSYKPPQVLLQPKQPNRKPNMEEITKLYLQVFFEGDLVFYHWNVHATLNLPFHKNLY